MSKSGMIYSKSVALGGTINLFDNNGHLIATFTNDDNGKYAFGLFQGGLARDGKFKLYDNDQHQYLVGTLADLDIEPAVA